MTNIYPKVPGVYCFWNKASNKIYVGSAQCLYTRINNHLKSFNSNPHLQRAIQYYGIDSFCITYIEIKTSKEALCFEQMLLDYIFKFNILKYNISTNAYGGDGSNAKVRYALEVNNSTQLYTFESGVKAARFTKVLQSIIQSGCKNAKPLNSESGRWLFSDVSLADLQTKFNNLTQAKIKGFNSYKNGFILINKHTKEQSKIFTNTLEPQKQGYKIHHSSLGQCLLGNRKTVNGYYVALCI